MKLASRTQRQKRAPGSTRSCSISRACRNLSGFGAGFTDPPRYSSLRLRM
jgi:hypothetical protein